MTQKGQARHGLPGQPGTAHKGLGHANGRVEGSDENLTMKEVQEGGQHQISEDGGEEMAMEKRLWLWILEQRRTEAGKGGVEKKRPDERSEDDGLEKKQGNGGEEEEAGNGAGGGYDEATDQDMGGTRMVDLAGGEAVGGKLGKEAVEDRQGAAVLAVEGEEGKVGVGGDWRQHWLLPNVLNRERKKRGGEEAKRKEKIGLLAQDLLCGPCQPKMGCGLYGAAIFFLTGRARYGHIFSLDRWALAVLCQARPSAHL